MAPATDETSEEGELSESIDHMQSRLRGGLPHTLPSTKRSA
jgi:hypothetical protein